MVFDKKKEQTFNLVCSNRHSYLIVNRYADFIASK